MNWRPLVDFFEQVEDAKRAMDFQANEECFFRGHASSQWELTPSLLRPPWVGQAARDKGMKWHDFYDLEQDLFYEFRARAKQLHGESPSDWEVLFWMRHYELPTRLLDWTEVLGIAMWFALTDVPAGITHSPCVWLLNPYALNKKSVGLRDLYAPENLGWDKDESEYYSYGELLLEGDFPDWNMPVAIYPRQSNPRMYAQRAWFTIHGASCDSLDRQCSKFKRPKVATQVKIPDEAIPAAREFLTLAGIDRFIMKPELEGLTKWLSEKYGAYHRNLESERTSRQRKRNKKKPAARAGRR